MLPFLAQDPSVPLGPYVIYIQQPVAAAATPPWISQPTATIIAGTLAVLGALVAFFGVRYKDSKEAERATRASRLDALADAGASFSSLLDTLRRLIDARAVPRMDSAIAGVMTKGVGGLDNEIRECKVASTKLYLLGMNNAYESLHRGISMVENYAVAVRKRSNIPTANVLTDLETYTLDQFKLETKQMTRAEKRQLRRFIKGVKKTAGYKEFQATGRVGGAEDSMPDD